LDGVGSRRYLTASLDKFPEFALRADAIRTGKDISNRAIPGGIRHG